MRADPSISGIRGYSDLTVWKIALDLVVEIYSVSRRFPADERFGLTSQIRRAAVSIAANIAEGHSRSSRREYRHFASIARGSVAELETELAIAERLQYVAAADLSLAREYADHVGRMLSNLRRRLGD
jgi:four helix bundle protein